MLQHVQQRLPEGYRVIRQLPVANRSLCILNDQAVQALIPRRFIAQGDGRRNKRHVDG